MMFTYDYTLSISNLPCHWNTYAKLVFQDFESLRSLSKGSLDLEMKDTLRKT